MGAVDRATPSIARAASAMGDPTRAAMLLASMGGPRSAGQLAASAAVSASTASSHLRRLGEAHLVEVTAHGRQRYYALAGPSVAAALEALGHLSPPAPIRSLAASSRGAALRRARTCYDHLAGKAGVWLLDALLEQGWLARAGGGNFDLTAVGIARLAAWSAPWPPVAPSRRRLAFACPDWSEERPHLAGALGAAITRHLLQLGWMMPDPGQRTVRLSAAGRDGLTRLLGVAPPDS